MTKRIFVIFLLFAAVSLYAQNNGGLLNKYALAQSYEQSGDLKKAAKLYEELYLADPNNNLYFESLNRVYMQLKNYAASINLIEQAIKRKPRDINLYGMLGSSYYLMGNEQKAFETWDEPFSLFEPNAVFYRVIAGYAIERRAFEKAIELYQKGKELSDDKVIFSYDLARLYSVTMQYEKAAEEYCEILNNDPQQLLTVQTNLLSLANKPDALEKIINVVEDFGTKRNTAFDYLLARLYIEAKQYDKAFDAYLKLDRIQKQQGRELLNYARFLFREKEYALAKEVYEKIIDLYPESPMLSSAKLGYARTLEADLMDDYQKHIPSWKPFFPVVTYDSEKIEDVIDAFNEIIETYRHSKSAYEAMLRIGMIKFYLQNNQTEAKTYFNKIIKEASNSENLADAYKELGEIALLNGDLSEAERNYLHITVLAKLNIRKVTDAKYRLARIRFYKGDIEPAQKLLADILKNLKDDNANDALQLSMLLNSSKIDSSNLKTFAEAEFLAEQKKFNEAAEKYKLIAENQQAFLLHSIASIRLAEMKLAVNDYQQAIELFTKVVEEGEKNIYSDKALYLLGEIYQYGLGNNAKAVEMYEKLLVKFPASIYLDDAREKINILKEKIS